MLSSNYNLVELFRVLEEYCDNKNAFQDIYRERRIEKALKLKDTHGTLLSKAKNDLCPFAYKKFLIQYAQKDFYAFSEVLNNEGIVTGWNVRRNRLVVDSTTELNEEVGDIDKDFAVDADNSHTVWFVDIKGNCTCQYRKCSGIACRHVLNVSASKVVDSNSGITGVIGGATIDYWLSSSMNPASPVVREALAIVNSDDSMTSFALLKSPKLTKEEKFNNATTIASKLVEYVIGTNPNDSKDLESDLKSLLNKFVKRNSHKKSNLHLDLEKLADSSSLSLIKNPVRKEKQAGRHKGQYEYATGVAKANKRKQGDSSTASRTSKARGTTYIELLADGSEKEQLN
jgi:hypothetical protein